MMRVISSPSMSTTGLATLILDMDEPWLRIEAAEAPAGGGFITVHAAGRKGGACPCARWAPQDRDERTQAPGGDPGPPSAGREHRRRGAGDGQFRPFRPAPG